MKIDAHQHFWNYDSANFEWLTDDMSMLRRDFVPADLDGILTQNNIDGCVLVQVNQTENETLFLNDIAENHDFVKGVVGWTDLLDKNLEVNLEKYSEKPKIKGFRHILQAEPQGFMLNPQFIHGIQKLAKYQFTFDILINPSLMKDAKQMIKTCPDNLFVIDHLAKPYIKDQKISQWANYMQKLGEMPNVYCKLSGMVAEADWENWKKEDFYIYLDIALSSFGIDRLMYGSDWPVCLVAAQYEEQLDIVQSYFEKLTSNEQEKIFGVNAVEFYKL